ncbi:putative membrane protein [uncultured delta proteobacterium]|uniref:Putative membrane protein n=1 Tax=uncultured delta proteobacterium TaxID=34034 RepID=A0A212J1F1_9DELT|nr:putative membrane protein [uncultured delta proteobacterium]
MQGSTLSSKPDAFGLASTFNYQVCREWGWVAFRGVLAIVFGVLAFFWPLATIMTLALFWGAFMFMDGVGAGITGWRLYRRGVRWWPYLAFAVIGVLAGLVTLVMPGVTAIALVYVIAFWAMLGGVSQIAAAFRLRKEIQGEWLLALAGAVSVLFGLLLAFRPLPEGVVAISWMIGAYALMIGVLNIMLALKLRGKGRECATVH